MVNNQHFALMLTYTRECYATCHTYLTRLVYSLHNIIPPCGLVPIICQLYYVRPPNKVRIFIYYSYIQAFTWKSGWSYTPITIHKNHCSIQHYSQKISSIPRIMHTLANSLHGGSVVQVDDITSIFDMGQ